mmetsp:Transcript_107369/g.256488  ORF Transcript_107369/g.256488 Transcript_107369/m.256488 type:complete len:213 (-) Transcript_107369:52-690(-)
MASDARASSCANMPSLSAYRLTIQVKGSSPVCCIFACSLGSWFSKSCSTDFRNLAARGREATKAPCTIRSESACSNASRSTLSGFVYSFNAGMEKKFLSGTTSKGLSCMMRIASARRCSLRLRSRTRRRDLSSRTCSSCPIAVAIHLASPLQAELRTGFAFSSHWMEMKPSASILDCTSFSRKADIKCLSACPAIPGGPSASAHPSSVPLSS